jgi:phage portal protein BeeE
VFGSGVPNGYLKVNASGLTQEQADQLKQRWLDAHGGSKRSIAVLNSTTDFTPISWNPVDAALAEVKRLSIADVAFAFGMAPETLGVTLGNSATYSNVRQWFEAHRDFALQPWQSVVEATLSALFPRGTEVRVNFDAYTDDSAGVTSGTGTLGGDAS